LKNLTNKGGGKESAITKSDLIVRDNWKEGGRTLKGGKQKSPNEGGVKLVEEVCGGPITEILAHKNHRLSGLSNLGGTRLSPRRPKKANNNLEN